MRELIIRATIESEKNVPRPITSFILYVEHGYLGEAHFLH